MNPAALLAVDPVGLGGAVLRGPPGPARDRWLADLRDALPPGTPMRRVPLHIGEERLLGGLDLAATLRTGRPCEQAGLLAEADGGVLVLACAERIAAGTAAQVAAALDVGEVVRERQGLGTRRPARIAVVALDEGVTPEECAPGPLRDRLAFHLVPDPSGPDSRTCRDAVRAARDRLAGVVAGPGVLEGLCTAAAALGIPSLRAPILAMRAARAAAALAGRDHVLPEDAELAAALVLAPRATSLPQPAPRPDMPADAPSDAAPDMPTEQSAEEPAPSAGGQVADTVLAAAVAAMPPGLLAGLEAARTRGIGPAGRHGQAGAHGQHGRPAGVRAGDPGRTRRLDLVETLRAAAPWQRLRAREGQRTIQVRREDFRVTHRQARPAATTIFLLDASGSHAAQRMAEAKGAIQLLLAECYVRRDQVAVLAFRGAAAELLLPPTRSLARARRSLAGLPGGGGTPLATGMDAACALATAIRRRDGAPALVLLTDGRPNVDRGGRPGRPAARADAEDAARRIRTEGHRAVLVDTSLRPQPDSLDLARLMGARYVPLPFADSAGLLRAVASR